MYIQITTRCNMECDHCCYSCTAKGEDMTEETFRKCLEWDSEYPAIGGGEPTIHPDFEKFLLIAISQCEGVWLAINGKMKERALMLAKLAKRGVVGCDLSLDAHHEFIDPETIEAFTKDKPKDRDYVSNSNSNDLRGIRNNDGKEINGGRCDFGNNNEDGSNCVCPGLMCKPNGDLYECGCEDAPKIGNVNNEELDFQYRGECWKYEEEDDGN